MGHVDLNPVGAVIELLARGLARFDGTVDDLDALRHFDLGRVTFEGISAGGRDGASGDEKTRPGNVSAFDGHFDADVAVAGAFGFHVAERGETLLEGAPG